MYYYSTRDKNRQKVNAQTAILIGLAPDGGLYMPAQWPNIPKEIIRNEKKLPLGLWASAVLQPFFSSCFSPAEMDAICSEAFTFPLPLHPLNEENLILELFHGPTLAFKDIGARFLAKCLEKLAHKNQQEIHLVIATSGDTGGAVAAAFHGLHGLKVSIFYPSGKISLWQEQQIATWNENIQAYEIEGNFDDCQALVKQLLSEKKEAPSRTIQTTANSINIARWLPQMIYYLHAARQFESNAPILFSVPSGNLGNIAAALAAHLLYPGYWNFMAAHNANDAFPLFLKNGNYQPKNSIATISNAMDVGNPSNIERVNHLLQEFPDLKEKIQGVSINEKETKKTMDELWNKYQYMCDPHTAVGYAAAQHWKKRNHPLACSLITIHLATAHPAKFPEQISPLAKEKLHIPERLQRRAKFAKTAIKCKASFQSITSLLVEQSFQHIN